MEMHNIYRKNLTKNKYCKCGKIIDYRSKRCHSCEMKRRYKIKIMNNSGKNNPMADIHRIGINSPNYKTGKPKCAVCGKELKYYNTNQCKKCYLNSLFGGNNPNWKGGITKLINKIRNSKQYKLWVKKVFERDNYTCQDCKEKSKGNIEAHHKIPLSNILILYSITTMKQALKCKLLWDGNWGVTLCQKCHKKLPKKGV